MNDKKAKIARRYARSACDPSLTRMHVRSHKGVHPVQGEIILYTAFWPMHSYRRILREFKEGKPAGRVVAR